MEDDEEFVILIYHEPVEMEAPVRGKERYLREIAFLKELTGWFSPNPDESPTVFPLDDAQFDAYSDFRRNLNEEYS